MNKFELYLSNLGIAISRVPKAMLGSYWHIPQDGYALNVLVTLDCLANAILFGDPDETISSRAGKAMEDGKKWGCILCKLIGNSGIFSKDHCVKAIQRDKGRRAVVPLD